MVQIKKNEHCFGGVNCDVGYRGFYPECFDGAKRILSIKGGPGTGKSHLMKSFAEAAEKKGERVRRIYCGSDAASLDGVYFLDRGIGVLDATAPHPFEPGMPGVDGEILNLGNYWDGKVLRKEHTAIVDLNTRKQKGYEAVYRIFAAMRLLATEILSMQLPLFDFEKMEKAAERTADTLRGKGKCLTHQLHAIGMCGDVVLDNLDCDAVVYLKDEFDCGFLYLDLLLKHAKEKCVSCLVSYHPIYHDRIEALTFPERRISYCAARCKNASRTMHMRRFLRSELYAPQRERCKSLTRMLDEMYRMACDHFSSIRDAHFALETIYSSAMDFGALKRGSEKQWNAFLCE